MVGYYKKYIILALNCMLKNSKKMILTENIEIIIQNKIRTYRTLKRTFVKLKR